MNVSLEMNDTEKIKRLESIIEEQRLTIETLNNIINGELTTSENIRNGLNLKCKSTQKRLATLWGLYGNK